MLATSQIGHLWVRIAIRKAGVPKRNGSRMEKVFIRFLFFMIIFSIASLCNKTVKKSVKKVERQDSSCSE
jgi:hypothetical protein